MPNCPICGEEINHLKALVIAIREYKYTPNKDYKESHELVNDIILVCPKCSQILFTDIPSAEDFFKS